MLYRIIEPKQFYSLDRTLAVLRILNDLRVEGGDYVAIIVFHRTPDQILHSYFMEHVKPMLVSLGVYDNEHILTLDDKYMYIPLTQNLFSLMHVLGAEEAVEYDRVLPSMLMLNHYVV